MKLTEKALWNQMGISAQLDGGQVVFSVTVVSFGGVALGLGQASPAKLAGGLEPLLNAREDVTPSLRSSRGGAGEVPRPRRVPWLGKGIASRGGHR